MKEAQRKAAERIDHEEKQLMAEEIKETAQNQPKRNKSQEQRPKDVESSADSLDVSVGDKDDRNEAVADIDISTEPQTHDSTTLPLSLENLKALKSQYKSSTEASEQQQLLLKIERLIGHEKRKTSDVTSVSSKKKQESVPTVDDMKHEETKSPRFGE